MPDKSDAISSMVALLALYPPTARIFLNTWTWGYEPLLAGLLDQWPEDKLHVDRYKRSIYDRLSKIEGGELAYMRGRIVGGKRGFIQVGIEDDADGQSGEEQDEFADVDPTRCVSFHRSTSAPAAERPLPVRLHACDSRRRCEATWRQSASGPRARFGSRGTADDVQEDIVVAVNPAEMRMVEWDLYEEEVRRRLERAQKGEGEWPISLVRLDSSPVPLPVTEILIVLPP